MYRVVAPMVVLKVASNIGAPTMMNYSEGAILPDAVDQASLKRHLDEGLVEELELPKAPVTAKEPEQESADKPAAKATRGKA